MENSLYVTNNSTDWIGPTIHINQPENHLKSDIIPDPESPYDPLAVLLVPTFPKILSTFLPYIPQNIDLCLTCVTALLSMFTNTVDILLPKKHLVLVLIQSQRLFDIFDWKSVFRLLSNPTIFPIHIFTMQHRRFSYERVFTIMTWLFPYLFILFWSNILLHSLYPSSCPSSHSSIGILPPINSHKR